MENAVNDVNDLFKKETEEIELKQEKGFISRMKNNNWWISLLLAIPIGILANILTPVIQEKYSKYSENAAAKRIERMKTEYNEAKYYSENKEEFSIYMSSTIIQMTMIGAFTTIASGFLFFVQILIRRFVPFKRSRDSLRTYMDLTFFVIILFVSILIFSIGRVTLRDYENVRNFKENEKMILKEFE